MLPTTNRFQGEKISQNIPFDAFCLPSLRLEVHNKQSEYSVKRILLLNNASATNSFISESDSSEKQFYMYEMCEMNLKKYKKQPT